MKGRKLIKEVMIQAEHGAAYFVNKGQIQRVIMIDGPQVGDWTAFNALNLKENYDSSHSFVMNSANGTGNIKAIKNFYSRPPHLNVMFTTISDTVGTHWVICGAKCTPQRYKAWNINGSHRSCFGNLVEVLAPHGVTPEDVPDVFNMFMNVEYDSTGHYNIVPPVSGRGGYIDMQAEMDCLVALSACPAGDVSMVNGSGANKGNKRLKVEIWE